MHPSSRTAPERGICRLDCYSPRVAQQRYRSSGTCSAAARGCQMSQGDTEDLQADTTAS